MTGCLEIIIAHTPDMATTSNRFLAELRMDYFTMDTEWNELGLS